jgi:hypothetical protein
MNVSMHFLGNVRLNSNLGWIFKYCTVYERITSILAIKSIYLLSIQSTTLSTETLRFKLTINNVEIGFVFSDPVALWLPKRGSAGP